MVGQWVKIRTRDHTGQKSYSVKQKSYSTPSEASRVFPPELSFFDMKTSEALGTHHLQATVTIVVDKGNYKITELRTILQRESQNS